VAEVEEATLPSRIIKEQGLRLDSTPTFLFFGRTASGEVEASIRWIAHKFEDFPSTVNRLRQFPGNPWDRISI